MDAEGPTEFELGKSIIDGIIKTATVKHLIYSSAVSTSGYSGGVVKAKTTESKENSRFNRVHSHSADRTKLTHAQ